MMHGRRLLYTGIICVLFLFPLAGLTVMPPEGVYNTDLNVLCVSNKNAGDIRFSENGKEFVPYTAPVFCEVPDGEEAVFTFQFRVTEGGAVSDEKTVTYRIDKKKPAVPEFLFARRSDGTDYTLTLNEPGSIHIAVYHPFTGSKAAGTVQSGDTFFVPGGSSAVVFGEDDAGNRGPAAALIFDNGIDITGADTNSAEEYDSHSLFSVLNPVPGVWANMQTLVIESSEPMDFYYSASGADPLESGFAYDGPVLIEKEGPVTLNIAGISASGKKIEKKVEYTVVPGSPLTLPSDPVSSCIIAGNEGTVVIPAGALYAAGEDTKPFIEARSLSLAGLSARSRYIPVTIGEAGRVYRVVLYAPDSLPAENTAGEEFGKKSSIPGLRIHDWNFAEIIEEGKVFYSLDESGWQEYTGPILLDRSRSVLLEWYSDSSDDEYIWSVPLPPKPALTGMPEGIVSNTAVHIGAAAPGYELRYETGFNTIPPMPGRNSPLLLKESAVDTIYGDEAVCNIRIMAWYAGVRQGELGTFFTIDKKPPEAPVIIADTQETYSRNPVSVSFSGRGEISAAVSDSLTGSGAGLSADESVFLSGADMASLILPGDNMYAVSYRVSARARDAAGNISAVSRYTVTVDKNSFYVNSSAVHSAADGSPEYPFASLTEALSFTGKREYTRLFLEGTFSVDSLLKITAPVEISGVKNARIEFTGNAGLLISGVSVLLKDCLLEQTVEPAAAPAYSSDLLMAPLIQINGGSLDISNCSILVSGGISRSICSASGSTVRVIDSDLTVQTDKYGVLITGTDSSVVLNAVSGSLIARNGVCYSVTGGVLDMTDSGCTVTAGNGRAVEAFSTKVMLSGNLFVNTLVPKKLQNAVWLDSYSSLVKSADNSAAGFDF